jgi:hypothetical protein
MISIGTAVVLMTLTALASSAASASFFLMRELARSDDRCNHLQTELASSRSQTLKESRSASLPLERVSMELVALESKRIESGRCQKVQISLDSELADEDLADAFA